MIEYTQLKVMEDKMKYYNPIIKGFNPDPSICRVNDDYYLVTSSFEYFPGIPIYHSKDLVNWEQIGNCIHRSSQISLENTCDSGGIWAPTIRYHNGTFYVTVTADKQGNFIVSANDILGEWSDPVWVQMSGIDPSLYFEDSKAYYCTNQREDEKIEAISLAEIDIHTGELIDGLKAVWTGTGGGWLEAPHIYHIGEWYYLMTAEGGTSFNHMVTVARSKDIWGPYESYPDNPILTNRNDTSKQVQCAGHGDLVEDQNGNWWMVHLGTRSVNGNKTNLGRETFLMPVAWENEWPVVYGNKSLIENDGPLWAEQKQQNGLCFDFNSTEWEPQWLFLRNPKGELYKKGNGKLIMHPSVDTFENTSGSPAFAAIRQWDFKCVTETVLSFNPQKIGDEAGMILYLQSDSHYRICKRKTDKGNWLVVEKHSHDFKQIAYETEISEGDIRLKIVADPLFYYFYYSIDNQSMVYACKASTKFLSCEVAGRSFTGTVIGIYALCNENTNAVAEFYEFSMNTDRKTD